MSISSRSRSLRSDTRREPPRRGISLDRDLGRTLEGGPLSGPPEASVATGFFPGPGPTRWPGPEGPDGQAFTDAQTLRDLDLFPPTPEDPSLFGLLDRTRTAGGRQFLTEMLAGGRIDRETIARRQETIRFFMDASERERWSIRSSDRAVGYLEQYLDSYVHPLRGRRGLVYWIRALWYRTGYAKYYEYLDSCIRTLHRFVRSLSEARTDRMGDLPAELTAAREAIDQLLDHETTIDFLAAGGRFSRFRVARMFHFDDRYRGDLTPLVQRAIKAVHRIDAYVGLGRAAADLGLAFPNCGEPGAPASIDCNGLFHPFLAEPVANDVRLDPEQGFLFLTGPNMAGKTTLMKALGLSVYLAHLGLPVPCREMRFTLLDGIVSSLNVEDNLGKGYSFFFAEVRRVKDVAEHLHAGRRLLVLFDELFRGTNLKDAIDGSRLVIDGFRRFPASLFVLSSHLLELGEELSRVEDSPPTMGGPGPVPIRFLRFDAEVKNGRPDFSYELRDGVSHERLGMLILENEGIPDLLRPTPTGAAGAKKADGPTRATEGSDSTEAEEENAPTHAAEGSGSTEAEEENGPPDARP